MYRGNSSSSSRGLWRGRGQWSGNSRGRGTQRNNSASQAPRVAVNSPPLGRLVTKIAPDNNSTYDIQAGDAKIQECEYAASYSLVGSQPPELVIPGQPATWKPPQLPSQLPGDHGDYLRDQNGAQFPEHPMQPSVQSLFALKKDFDPSIVDIMGCASSLGDILRFVRSVDATFRYDVEMVGNTLFLVRNHRNEVIPDVRGYGHSFLDNFTSHQAEMGNIKSHQRIVSYSFGGLKCFVRFECDGHLAGNVGDISSGQPKPKIMNLPEPLVSSSIPFKSAGIAMPQNSVLEIKTRSQTGAPINMSEHFPRLWIRQIPNLIAAYHSRGNFEDVQEKHVERGLLDWETKHEHELQRFASVLRQLIMEVKRSGHLKLELCRTGSGPLELREQTGKPREVLPRNWKDMWATQHRTPDTVEGCLINGEDVSDDDEDETYPRYPSQKHESSESDASDDDFSLDYTACDVLCGYCGHCA